MSDQTVLIISDDIMILDTLGAAGSLKLSDLGMIKSHDSQW